MNAAEVDMPEREHKKKQATERREDVEQDEVSTQDSGEKIKAELDDLLDEIDDVLETNAEEFVKSYVQKGGE